MLVGGQAVEHKWRKGDCACGGSAEMVRDDCIQVCFGSELLGTY